MAEGWDGDHLRIRLWLDRRVWRPFQRRVLRLPIPARLPVVGLLFTAFFVPILFMALPVRLAAILCIVNFVIFTGGCEISYLVNRQRYDGRRQRDT